MNNEIVDISVLSGLSTLVNLNHIVFRLEYFFIIFLFK